MTRAMLMYERQLKDEQGHVFFLEYYLLTDESYFAGKRLEIYGAEIKMRRADGGQEECQRFRNITPSGPKITAMIGRMAHGLVTPIAMGDVVEDLIVQ